MDNDVELTKCCRKFAILVAIDHIPNVSKQEILDCTGLKPRTFSFLLEKLRVESGVVISRKRGARNSLAGAVADEYIIIDSGCFNLAKLPIILHGKSPDVMKRIINSSKMKSLHWIDRAPSCCKA